MGMGWIAPRRALPSCGLFFEKIEFILLCGWESCLRNGEEEKRKRVKRELVRRVTEESERRKEGEGDEIWWEEEVNGRKEDMSYSMHLLR